MTPDRGPARPLTYPKVNGFVVYAIENTINGHRYVGSSVKLARRIQAHRRELIYGVHVSPILQRAWVKYGPGAFRVVVLEEIGGNDRALLLAREQYYLDTGESTYNTNPVADRPPDHSGKKKCPHTTETKVLISKSKTGRLNPHGTPPMGASCDVCRKAFTRAAAAVKSGRAKYCSRRCMGLASAGRMAEIARRRRGTKESLEIRARRSAAQMGRVCPPDVRQKISAAKKAGYARRRLACPLS